MTKLLLRALPCLFLFSTGLNDTFAQVPWEIEIIKSEMISERPYFSRGFMPINNPGYYQLGRVTVEKPDGTRYSARKFLKYETMEVIDCVIPMDNFPKTHMATLNMKQTHNGILLHYNDSVSTVRFSRTINYKNTGDFVCQYNHSTGQWSELVMLGEASDYRFFNGFGASRDNKYFYYGFGVGDIPPPENYNAQRYELARFNLETCKVEKLFTLELPKRKVLLHLNNILISPDGRWLVLNEYSDRAHRKDQPDNSDPVAYIIDTKTKEYKTCRIPDTPYGHFITPDSKYMVVGGYETGEIFKIDLERAEKVKSIKGTKTIFEFNMAASGNYFLIEYDEEKCPRKVVDVRSAHDLKLITSVFLDDLYPEPNLSRTMTTIFDGRMVISRASIPNDTLKRANSVLIHALPTELSAAEPGSSLAERLRVAEIIANGKLYAERTQMELTPPKWIKGNAKSVTIGKDGNLIVTGKRDVGHLTWGAFIAKLTPDGKVIWETKLPEKKVSDTSAGLHIPTPDGGCIVLTFYFDHERAIGQTRISKISGSGEIVYHYLFPKFPNPGAIQIDGNLELLDDGSVRLKGTKYVSENEEVQWTGVLSADGKLVESK